MLLYFCDWETLSSTTRPTDCLCFTSCQTTDIITWKTEKALKKDLISQALKGTLYYFNRILPTSLSTKILKKGVCQRKITGKTNYKRVSILVRMRINNKSIKSSISWVTLRTVNFPNFINTSLSLSLVFSRKNLTVPQIPNTKKAESLAFKYHSCYYET